MSEEALDPRVYLTLYIKHFNVDLSGSYPTIGGEVFEVICELLERTFSQKGLPMDSLDLYFRGVAATFELNEDRKTWPSNAQHYVLSLLDTATDGYFSRNMLVRIVAEFS